MFAPGSYADCDADVASLGKLADLVLPVLFTKQS